MPVQVAAAILEREGKLLITKRPSGGHLSGYWEFPGGKREAGETFEQCLARELAEELSIEVEVGRLFKQVKYAYPEKTVEILFYKCRLVRGEPAARGCEDFRWVFPNELSNFSFPPADTKLIQEFKDHGKKDSSR